jgi:hypothetical protein
MATHRANTKERGPHAGTLAFLVLVPLADVIAALLASFYGATAGAWLVTFLAWCMVGLVAHLHSDLTATIFLILLIPFGLTVLLAEKGDNKAAGCLLSLPLVGLWLLLHFLFHIQGNSFIPNVDRFLFAFPNLRSFFTQLYPLGGLTWLVLHLLLHIGNDTPAAASVQARAEQPAPPPQEKPPAQRTRAAAQAPGAQPPPVVESTLASNSPKASPEEQTEYLNPLSVGEDKWDILVACIGRYEEALTRLRPPPFSRLKVPPRRRLRYVSSGYQVIWHGRTLVLTGPLLDPTNDRRLETGLARALWDYHSPDLWTRLVLSMYPDAPGCLAIPMSLLGVFMWIPATVKWALNYQDWRADRELAKVRFAWACGAGETLLHQTRQSIAAGREEPDPHLPAMLSGRGSSRPCSSMNIARCESKI